MNHHYKLSSLKLLQSVSHKFGLGRTGFLCNFVVLRTSNERSPRKYSADPLRACNTYNNGHPLVALFFDCEWKFARFLCAKDQALSKRLSKKFVGVVFTLEVAHTNIAKIAIYRQTYNFSCSEMKSQKTAAFLYGRDRKIVGIVLGNHRKSMKNFRKQNQFIARK